MKKMKITERTKCRASKGDLIDVFNLGHLPTSCFPLLEDDEPEKTPLVLCLNKESGLLQLRHSVDPDEMYKTYWYLSGMNSSMTASLKDIVNQATKRVDLIITDIVVDIASNDGTLLSHYPKHITRVGIDPSNIKTQNCDYYINEYFSAEVYRLVLGNKKAKIITSICVLYDLNDPIQFIKDVKSILDEDGLYVVEMSYLPLMLERNSFETIVNEHLEYYSLQSIEYILDRAGMRVEDVEINNVNGGSFRLYIRHSGKETVQQSVIDMREKEKMLYLSNIETYNNFSNRVEQNKNEMMEFLVAQKQLGKLVLGLAASTKGNTMLAYYGIGPDLMPYVADRNPMKFGRQTVTRIPIISEEEARELKPDYFVVFAYHFMDEIILREDEFLKRGGKLISPIPTLTIISGY
jgi:NDP-4-keto-2,6-dideoxyhexose 3-C-methyltransferase